MADLRSNSSLKTSCAECTLNSVCLPKYLKPSQVDTIENFIQRSRVIHKGDYIHRQGDKVKSLYIVRSGSVKEAIICNNGNEQILAFYFPGEIVGLDSLSKQIYNCSVSALETTTYCALPIKEFMNICSQIPSLQHMLLTIMSKALAFENKMLLSACNKNAEEKIATFLMTISKRYKRLGYNPTELRLPMSRQEIGAYFGLTSETVSRIFTDFQKHKIISIRSRQLKIKNMDALTKLDHGFSKHKTSISKISEPDFFLEVI